jgi:hypothetical protein
MRHVKTTDQTPASAERQIAGFIAKFEQNNQKLIRSVRKVLRKRFPTANELVYDYHKNFVIGYSPTERGSDAIVAMTADADGVALYFNQGPSLPDPHKILMGNGRQTRFIRLESAKVLLRPEVESLMTAAVRKAKIPLRRSGRGGLIIKSMSWKQRPRRQTVKR